MDEQQAMEAAAEPVEARMVPQGPGMSKAEHLQWCKDRANAYLPGDPQGACSSMMCDLKQHEELASHIGIDLLFQHMMLPGWLEDAEKVGRFIDGFK